MCFCVVLPDLEAYGIWQQNPETNVQAKHIPDSDFARASKKCTYASILDNCMADASVDDGSLGRLVLLTVSIGTPSLTVTHSDTYIRVRTSYTVFATDTINEGVVVSFQLRRRKRAVACER